MNKWDSTRELIDKWKTLAYIMLQVNSQFLKLEKKNGKDKVPDKCQILMTGWPDQSISKRQVGCSCVQWSVNTRMRKDDRWTADRVIDTQDKQA